MKPALCNGDFVLITPWLTKARLNKLLIVDHPLFGIIIKRVISINTDGSCWLDSDNSRGIGTEKIGLISPWLIVGRVLFTIRKDTRP